MRNLGILECRMRQLPLRQLVAIALLRAPDFSQFMDCRHNCMFRLLCYFFFEQPKKQRYYL